MAKAKAKTKASQEAVATRLGKNSKQVLNLTKAVKSAIWMLNETNDLYISDVRKLESAFYRLIHAAEVNECDID